MLGMVKTLKRLLGGNAVTITLSHQVVPALKLVCVNVPREQFRSSALSHSRPAGIMSQTLLSRFTVELSPDHERRFALPGFNSSAPPRHLNVGRQSSPNTTLAPHVALHVFAACDASHSNGGKESAGDVREWRVSPVHGNNLADETMQLVRPSPNPCIKTLLWPKYSEAPQHLPARLPVLPKRVP